MSTTTATARRMSRRHRGALAFVTFESERILGSEPSRDAWSPSSRDGRFTQVEAGPFAVVRRCGLSLAVDAMCPADRGEGQRCVRGAGVRVVAERNFQGANVLGGGESAHADHGWAGLLLRAISTAPVCPRAQRRRVATVSLRVCDVSGWPRWRVEPRRHPERAVHSGSGPNRLRVHCERMNLSTIC